MTEHHWQPGNCGLYCGDEKHWELEKARTFSIVTRHEYLTELERQREQAKLLGPLAIQAEEAKKHFEELADAEMERAKKGK